MCKTGYQKAEFEVLKQRLLLRELEKVEIREAHLQIMAEAAVAAEIAGRSGFPELVFPLLFEERVCMALQTFHIEEDRFWASLRSVVNNV